MIWLECKQCSNRHLSISGIDGTKTCLECKSHDIGWSK